MRTAKRSAFPTMGHSAGLDLAALGTAERREAHLTWNMPEVKVWRNCSHVVLSEHLCCICSDAYPLSTVHVGNQSFRAVGRGWVLCWLLRGNQSSNSITKDMLHGFNRYSDTCLFSWFKF